MRDEKGRFTKSDGKPETPRDGKGRFVKEEPGAKIVGERWYKQQDGVYQPIDKPEGFGFSSAESVTKLPDPIFSIITPLSLPEPLEDQEEVLLKSMWKTAGELRRIYPGQGEDQIGASMPTIFAELQNEPTEAVRRQIDRANYGPTCRPRKPSLWRRFLRWIGVR